MDSDRFSPLVSLWMTIAEVFHVFLLKVLEGTVSTRVEGTQAVTKEADKMWLVRLLEITRKYVLDDLVVVKNLMVQCFPPHYNTFNRQGMQKLHEYISTFLSIACVSLVDRMHFQYQECFYDMCLSLCLCCRFFSLYHNAVSTRVKELASEDLEANEIVSLLTWVLNTYKRSVHLSTLSTNFILLKFPGVGR